MPDCLFCNIAAREIPGEIVYEDDRTLAFLDIRPINPGHTLIIPKRHAENFAVTPPEDIAAVMAAAQKLAPAILRATGAEAFNFSTNNGRAAGQVVFHTHFHLMPRLPKDGYEHWRGPDVPADLASVGEKIRAALA